LLINDILDLSKLEAGHLELERVEFDLEEVVDQAIELTAVKARAKGIVMLSHLTPGVAAFLWGDPTRLKQVLINLLGNAVKFTQSGEVILTARNHESGKPGQIEFAVSDTGIGIPSEKLETIFDDFTQADVSMTRKYGGTGLGLGISRRLVEAMGGQLTASSSQGEGSTFRFVAQFDPAPEKSREIPVSPEEFRGKRALLINDNATGCLILRETVQNWGLESDAFGSPAEALVCLREGAEKRYSLAVIDVSSSAMDGFEVAVEIRRIAGNLPIVMLTSDSRPGDATRRVEAGLSGYAIKPVARAHLRRLIWEAMEMRGRSGPLPEENGVRKEQAQGAPCRILVAEDSEDNRLLIELFLKGSPYQLTFEVDGQAAVDRFATSDFDLILMDVRMPVMEGLAATRAIRALELQRGGSAAIPIIALTADASLKDVERSSNAGCNAHLSKPISKLQLLSAIETYRRRRPVDMAQPASLEPILIDIPPGLESIVPPYLASRRKEVNDMVELLAIPDFARLTRLGHNLKGSGGGYGFPELTRLGAAVEHLAKEKDGEGIRTTLTELSTYLDRVQLS
jgi:CheY-like chemotaxis protein/anti-sigma regulatory factor (Ser/Thr protein kinase)